ncbi:helix-turn-helix domain-containing protein [Cohnella fermenti]|uniref:helix-turn-helix domain-containing protein n=1 Tax=Cohnella fermenti TaxID=2565925 RepID=UPI001454BA25|nr:AraC family transcriptional regulator [Cohnella fermenti]
MIEPIAIYYERCEKGWQVPRSATANRILLLVVSGTMEYTIEETVHRLTKGDMLYVPEGSTRSAVNCGEEAFTMYVAHFRYEGDGEKLPLLQDHKPRTASVSGFDYARRRFSLLTQHWLRKSPCCGALCHSAALELLAILQEEADMSALPDKAYDLVVQLQDYILRNYRRVIPIAELASHVNRTPNYVSHIFRKTTGQTISAYMQQIRVSAACDLLTGSHMSIGEISDLLGFCEQSYFNKVFKKTTGFTPSVYVKEKPKLWLTTSYAASASGSPS